MFLRTGKNLKHLYIDEIIYNQFIFKNLYECTTITSVDLYLPHNIDDYFKSKAIDVLVKTIRKNSTLASLKVNSTKFGFERVETVLEALYNNTVINSLSLYDSHISAEEGKMLAMFLYMKTTITSLTLCGGEESWSLYGV
ncbi:hypothetical protein F8M41_008853 [Gigaspora margarita]|nr:hypothetical protein F8M41_008853 [Gigaspora margarita]